jgi:hypothetical protein
MTCSWGEEMTCSWGAEMTCSWGGGDDLQLLGDLHVTESIPGLFKSLKMPSQVGNSGEGEDLQATTIGYERVQMINGWEEG